MSSMGQGYFYTPENEEQAIALQRKRAYADALLRSQGTQGAYGGLADAGRMIAGALVAKRADEGQRNLAKESSDSYAQKLAAFLGGNTGSPAPQSTPPMDENGASIPSPQVSNGPQPQGDPRMAALLSSADPRLLSQFGPALFQHQLSRGDKMEDRALDRQDKARVTLSPEESQRLGARPGTLLERDSYGGLHEIQASDVMSPEAFKQKKILAEIARMRLGGTGGAGGKAVQSSRQLSDGTIAILYKDGTSERLNIDGTPVIGAQYDPNNTYQRAAASAGGKAAGTVAEGLPTTEATFAQINRSLDAFDRPEVKAQADRSLGFLDKRAPAIAGYNADFMNQQKQIEGQTFLQAFNALRGAGQITEIEGTKATNALTRMQNAASAKEFYRARDEAKQVFSEIQGAMRQRAGRGAVIPQLGGGAPQAKPDPLGLR